VVLKDSAAVLRNGANSLSVLLQPAVAVALRSKARNAYRIPTMAVSAAACAAAAYVSAICLKEMPFTSKEVKVSLY
jgi:hypothetical protein